MLASLYLEKMLQDNNNGRCMYLRESWNPRLWNDNLTILILLILFVWVLWIMCVRFFSSYQYMHVFSGSVFLGLSWSFGVYWGYDKSTRFIRRKMGDVYSRNRTRFVYHRVTTAWPSQALKCHHREIFGTSLSMRSKCRFLIVCTKCLELNSQLMSWLN